MWAMAAPASEVSQSKWSASALVGCGIRQALLFRHHQYVAETPPHYNYPTLAAPAREQQLRLDAFPALPCRCPILARKRLGDEPLDLAGLFQLEQISYSALLLPSSSSRFPNHSRLERRPAALPQAGYRCMSRTSVARMTMRSDCRPALPRPAPVEC